MICLKESSVSCLPIDFSIDSFITENVCIFLLLRKFKLLSKYSNSQCNFLYLAGKISWGLSEHNSKYLSFIESPLIISQTLTVHAVCLFFNSYCTMIDVIKSCSYYGKSDFLVKGGVMLPSDFSLVSSFFSSLIS